MLSQEPKKRGSVVCFGLAVLDVLVPGLDDGVFSRDVTRIESFKLSTGGDAINEAILLAKLGHNVKLLSMVGSDAFGRLIIESGKRDGVDMTAVRMHETLQTTMSMVCIKKGGDRSFIVNSGADNAIDEACIDYEAVKSADVVTVGSAFACEKLTESLPKLLKLAKESGAATLVDVMKGSSCMAPVGLAEFLPYTDFIFPNEEEGRFLAGETEPDNIAKALLDMGAGAVVLKLGARGCKLYKSDAVLTVPGYKALNVADTTGAGDNFLAGFASALMEGGDLKECCEFAAAAGACSVGYVGAVGIKNRQEVFQMFKNGKIY